MISTFSIRNFRLFKQLEIEHLSQVNLIVGQNSVGKSALLEALAVYCSKADIRTIRNQLLAREELWLTDQDIGFRNNPIRHLYLNHQLPDFFTEEIELNSDKNKLTIAVTPYTHTPENTKQLLTQEDLSFFSDEEISIQLAITNGDLNKQYRPLIFNRPLPTSLKTLQISNFNLVSITGVENIESAKLWDNISLTEHENNVIKGLQIINPNVSGIAFVESHKNGYRIPLIKLSNLSERIPLKALGDGMTRIFEIILSLVCSKDGMLLIDEFETGLHWSVQQATWNMVFTLAKALNVQVFATTHSRDCVKEFDTIWQQQPNSGSFYRLYREQETINIRSYDQELLNDSIETDTEVR